MLQQDLVPADPEDVEHVPVLAQDVLAGLQIGPHSRVVDATLGGGGHAAMLLERSAPDGRLLGLDADPAAIRRIQGRLANAIACGRLVVVHASFADLAAVAHQHDFVPVDAILFDLGVSSFQLETPERGFSFMHDGQLDMRFDPTGGTSAAEIVNTWQERELADLIYECGEEQRSRQIARRIVAARPIESTVQLARIVEAAVGGRRGMRIHPATKTFQALRIGANLELEQLQAALPQCLDIVKPGGRIAVISFHSLEDRIVKQWMQQEARAYVPDPSHPRGGYARQATLQVITRRPVQAGPAEIRANPRSRSAKLRIAERL